MRTDNTKNIDSFNEIIDTANETIKEANKLIVEAKNKIKSIEEENRRDDWLPVEGETWYYLNNRRTKNVSECQTKYSDKHHGERYDIYNAFNDKEVCQQVADDEMLFREMRYYIRKHDDRRNEDGSLKMNKGMYSICYNSRSDTVIIAEREKFITSGALYIHDIEVAHDTLNKFKDRLLKYHRRIDL